MGEINSATWLAIVLGGVTFIILGCIDKYQKQEKILVKGRNKLKH